MGRTQARRSSEILSRLLLVALSTQAVDFEWVPPWLPILSCRANRSPWKGRLRAAGDRHLRSPRRSSFGVCTILRAWTTPRSGMGRTQARRYRGLEVEHQLEFSRLLDRQIAGLGALENLVDEEPLAAEDVVIVRRIGHQPARHHMLVVGVNRWQSILDHLFCDPYSFARQKWIGHDEHTLRGQTGRRTPGHNQVNRKIDQLGSERRKSLRAPLGKRRDDSFLRRNPDPAAHAASLEQWPGLVRENTDFPYTARCLRNGSARPHNNRATEQRDELAPPDAKCHLIPPAGRATEG